MLHTSTWSTKKHSPHKNLKIGLRNSLWNWGADLRCQIHLRLPPDIFSTFSCSPILSIHWHPCTVPTWAPRQPYNFWFTYLYPCIFPALSPSQTYSPTLHMAVMVSGKPSMVVYAPHPHSPAPTMSSCGDVLLTHTLPWSRNTNSPSVTTKFLLSFSP